MSKEDYKVIVKSSALSGSAGAVAIFASFARTKLIAVFAGPQGVGMLGLYTSAIGLVSSVSSLGLGSSAVRDVAVASGSNDAGRSAHVIKALRRLTWATGLLGATACIVGAPWISRWTFGNEEHARNISILAVCVLLAQLSAGQSALLRGLRKIKELALQSIVISFLTLVFAGLAFGYWGLEGIVPFLLATHAVTLTGTWWFARKTCFPDPDQSLRETFVHTRSMFAMGISFQVSALITATAAHIIGIMIFNAGGSQMNGYYQAAWGSTGALVSLVLNAMGQDFYPRLATVCRDGSAAMRLINQQTEVGIFLALPLLAVFVATAPIVIPLLFTAEFTASVQAVVWFGLGAFGRVISWPLGYYLIAAGRGGWFFVTELVFASIHLALASWLIEGYGLKGAGIAWFMLYLVYWAGMAVIVGRICGQVVGRSALFHSFFGLVVLIVASLLGPVWGLLLCAPLALVCLRSLIRRVGRDNRLSQRLIGLPVVGKFLSS